MIVNIKYGLSFLGLLVFAGCTVHMDVFDQESFVDSKNSIGNFHSTDIFSDRMSDEIWSSKEGDCLVVTQEDSITYSGSGSVHLKWDKISGDCPWLGMGFGWDGWSGKNLSKIYETSAIQFKIRSGGEPMKSLPVAFCMEDYSNLQAWTGFSRKMLDTETISDEWSTMTIPILSFNWEEFEADITNVKQLMIQFEAAGDVYIDDVKIVEHKGSLKKQAVVNISENRELGRTNFTVDNSDETVILIEKSKVFVEVDENFMYINAFVIDETPLENTGEGDKIWDGDGLEVAFSTNAEAGNRRRAFLVSDQQIGIKASENPMVWDWKKHVQIKDAVVNTKRTETGYVIDAVIPLSHFGIKGFQEGSTYGLEVAIDSGTSSGRQMQLRWNSPDQDGFYKDPSLWGEMLIQKIIQN
ncbi:MAG: hypothetical protein ACI8XB_002999 [Patiriisocius sp.]|jgi:hypothetical protein